MKAKLLESQCPNRKTPGSGKMVETRAGPKSLTILFRQTLLTCFNGGQVGALQGTWVAYSNLKDMKRAPTAVLNVNRVRNARLPKRGDPHGNGVSVVVSGRESRLQGEGGQASQVNGRTWGNV